MEKENVKEEGAIIKDSSITSVAGKNMHEISCFVNVQQITSEIEKKTRLKVLLAVVVAAAVVDLTNFERKKKVKQE